MLVGLTLPVAAFAQAGQPSQLDQQQATRDTMGELALSLAETRAQLLMTRRQVAAMQEQLKSLIAAKPEAPKQ